MISKVIQHEILIARKSGSVMLTVFTHVTCMARLLSYPLGDMASQSQTGSHNIVNRVFLCRNVIDTAHNYRSGRSEASIGQALNALQREGTFKREMLFISTKAGFLDQAILQDLLNKGKVQLREVAGGIHCISPSCLQASIDLSLQRLNIKTVSILC